MSAFKMNDFRQYPPHIFDTYSKTINLGKIAKEAMQQGDYELVRYIIFVMIKHTKQTYLCDFALSYAIEHLDIEAVRAITEEYIRHNDPELGFKIKTVAQCHTAWSREDDFGFPENPDDQLQKIQIVKIIFELQSEVSDEDLGVLSVYLNKHEFYELIEKKNIDLNDKKFKKLKPFLVKYELDNKQPLNTKIDRASSIEKILLSRTYSDVLSAQEVEAIYHSLMELDPLARAMLLKIAMDILKQKDPVRIIFNPGLSSGFSPHSKDGSHYNHYQKIITIDTDLTDYGLFTNASIAIHEFGHYVLHEVFMNGGKPNLNIWHHFFPSEAVEFVKRAKGYGLSSIGFNKIKRSVPVITAIFSTDKILNVASIHEEYELGVKKVLTKAAELMKTDVAVIEELQKYDWSSEMIQYFQANTYISLFFVKFAYSITGAQKLELSAEKTFIDAYLAYHYSSTCPDYNLLPPPSAQEIEETAMEKFFPKLAASLTKEQLFFLKRIGEWVHRGCIKYSTEFCNSDHWSLELAVRYLELKASEVGESLLDAFSGLAAYLKNHMLPPIVDECNQYNEALIAEKDSSGCHEYGFSASIEECNQYAMKPELECSILAY